MIRRMPMLAGWLAALILTACASNTASTQGGSPDTSAQPDTGAQVTPGPSNPTTPPDPALGTEPQVTGSVTYRERIALTPDAVLMIEVVEQTPEGSPGNVISQQTQTGPGQVPIRFSVAINPQRIRPGATYVLNARIMDGARVFSSASPVPVLTQGNRSSDVEVLVGLGR